MFTLQEEPPINYNIIKYDYNIEISLTKTTINIQNLKKSVSILITLSPIWDGKKRFIISNNNYESITVLHPIVETDPVEMCKHLISAFKNIIPDFCEIDLLYLFDAILSLSDYIEISNKFSLLWNNKYIKSKYKLLKNKKKYDIVKNKIQKYENSLIYLESKMKTEQRELNNKI